jgi:hypothetical protein
MHDGPNHNVRLVEPFQMNSIVCNQGMFELIIGHVHQCIAAVSMAAKYVMAHQIHLKMMTAYPNYSQDCYKPWGIQFSWDHISETLISGCPRSVASLRPRHIRREGH